MRKVTIQRISGKWVMDGPTIYPVSAIVVDALEEGHIYRAALHLATEYPGVEIWIGGKRAA